MQFDYPFFVCDFGEARERLGLASRIRTMARVERLCSVVDLTHMKQQCRATSAFGPTSDFANKLIGDARASMVRMHPDRTHKRLGVAQRTVGQTDRRRMSKADKPRGLVANAATPLCSVKRRFVGQSRTERCRRVGQRSQTDVAEGFPFALDELAHFDHVERLTADPGRIPNFIQFQNRYKVSVPERIDQRPYQLGIGGPRSPSV